MNTVLVLYDASFLNLYYIIFAWGYTEKFAKKQLFQLLPAKKHRVHYTLSINST